jgi:serine O-acetyltransferase
LGSFSGLIREIRADYVRHGSRRLNPAWWAVAVYRYGRWSLGLRGPSRWLTSKVYGLLNLFVLLASGIELNREVRVGSGFHLVHSGNIKIHPDVVIGDRCGIMHDVTLGMTPDRPGVPRIGDDVFIGAGAKVLGPVTLGNAARVAGNSLVLVDVPPGATAIGVPARILRFTGRAGEGAAPPASA